MTPDQLAVYEAAANAAFAERAAEAFGDAKRDDSVAATEWWLGEYLDDGEIADSEMVARALCRTVKMLRADAGPDARYTMGNSIVCGLREQQGKPMITAMLTIGFAPAYSPAP